MKMRRLCSAFLAVFLISGIAEHAKALPNESETDVFVGLTTRSTGIIQLKTMTSDGTPLGDVSIYLELHPVTDGVSLLELKPGEEAFLGKTDGEGVLKLDPVVFGSYSVTARKNGYHSASSEIVMDQPIVQELKLALRVVHDPDRPSKPSPSPGPSQTPPPASPPAETPAPSTGPAPGESQPPTGTTPPEGGDLPRTGGESYWVYWVVLVLNSVLLVGLLVLYHGRKKG